MTDPFYNEGSTGVLIYDPSGWMSVQIVGQPRPDMDVSASRPGRADSAEEDRLKAEVLDSYYAYFGTWTYDETSSTVTHHIKSSLFPSETGVSYTQTATLEGENLVFKVRRDARGGATVQQKVGDECGTTTRAEEAAAPTADAVIVERRALDDHVERAGGCDDVNRFCDGTDYLGRVA
jgi:hypothetical protein